MWHDYARRDMVPRLREIRYRTPYFNASGGKDHLVVYVGDNGPRADCIVPMERDPFLAEMLEAMVAIGYYGRTDPAFGDGARAWKPGLDISMPMSNNFHTRAPPPSWAEHVKAGAARKDIFFRGNYGNGCAFSCPHALTLVFLALLALNLSDAGLIAFPRTPISVCPCGCLR